MADAGNEIRIMTVPLDPASWTLISAPSDVRTSVITVRNQQQVDLMIRSDCDDPTTQDTIPAGYERTFRYRNQMYHAPLFYAQPVSGTGPLVVVCNP
jgi:hypothetical protein